METKFNFKSQVCTDKVQSERLLALGLKKETADMHWEDEAYFDDYEDWNAYVGSPKHSEHIPAWSLHRLWCLLPNSITIEHWMYARKYAKILDLSMDSYQNVSYTEGIVEPCHDMHFYANDAYESICKAIEWLIKVGYFNKEFLV